MNQLTTLEHHIPPLANNNAIYDQFNHKNKNKKDMGAHQSPSKTQINHNKKGLQAQTNK